MTDARRYAVFTDPGSRSRSWGFWSSENCTFLGLSLCRLRWELANDHWFLNYSTISEFGQAGFLIFLPVFVSRDLELGAVPAVSHPQRSFSNFSDIWYVDGWWLMHDSMLYDPIQGQDQGHDCLKPLKRSWPSVPHRTNFFFIFQILMSKTQFFVGGKNPKLYNETYGVFSN